MTTKLENLDWIIFQTFIFKKNSPICCQGSWWCRAKMQWHLIGPYGCLNGKYQIVAFPSTNLERKREERNNKRRPISKINYKINYWRKCGGTRNGSGFGRGFLLFRSFKKHDKRPHSSTKQRLNTSTLP